MSHYIRSTMAIKSRAALVAALEELGFHPEVHDDLVQLRGMGHGDRAAHVVVRIADFPAGAATRFSGDVGFREEPDGTWVALVDDVDAIGRYGGTAWAGAAWQARVTQLAGVHADLALAAELGLVAERGVFENGDQYVDVYAREG